MAQASLKLGDVAKVGVNMPDADFWVVRRGSEREVGRPVKAFNPEHFGIKVTQTDVLDPGHLYYALVHLHGQGAWKLRAHGTLALVNLRASDFRNIPLASHAGLQARGRASGDFDYRMSHRPAGKEDSAPAHDLSALYPEDVYGPDGARIYSSGYEALDREALSILRAVRGKPNARITMYRTVPKVLTVEQELDERLGQLRYILKHGKVPPESRETAAHLRMNASQYYNYVSDIVEGLRARQPEGGRPKSLESIQPGDWVTITRGYARHHGESNVGGRSRYRILQKTVKASELFTDGNSLQEWGYAPS